MEDLGVKNLIGRPDPAFWKGRRVLLTGHTGFKGAWLAHWLDRMGAAVTGLALEPTSTPNLFDAMNLQARCDSHIIDIRDADAVARVVKAVRPEVVLHLAAQALVRESYRSPLETFDTNVMGTAHVLEAIRASSATRIAVMVTTDKVYRNREWHWPYREDDALGGHDPYSASKAASEAVIESYRLSFLEARGVTIASARAGNVIGGGDWSADRLVPDIVRAWQTGKPLSIRRPSATRPWQHVLEPLAAYLVLAEKLWHAPTLAGAYNFGPASDEAASVRDIVGMAQTAFPTLRVQFDDGDTGPHEAGWLALETARARHLLGIRSRFTLEAAIGHTLGWYVHAAQGADACDLCDADIAAWMEAA